MKTECPKKNMRLSTSRQMALILVVLVLLVALGVMRFMKFYNAYNEDVLYKERLNQMQEVTEQLFAGLEDVVKVQWKLAKYQCNYLNDARPQTVDSMVALMNRQVVLNELKDGSEIIAIDTDGRYYTQNGKQGLMADMTYLDGRPAQVSYVFNEMTRTGTQMMFLYRLDEPLVLRDGGQTSQILYYGLALNMNELDPYFDCKAYDSNNSMYVVDRQGLKLFSGNNGRDLLAGFNAFSVLRNMRYLHDTSFDETLDRLHSKGLAYSNAILDGEEYYYALYQMENAEWMLLFLVPSSCVATNTVQLVNTTTRMLLIFAVVMTVVCAGLIFCVLQIQQRRTLRIAEANNAILEKNNRELERTQAAATEALRAAETASKAKTDFLANMSHDIRTPMNAIVGLTNLMENELDDRERLLDHLSKLKASSQHLLNLINDILDMNKIESGAKTLNITQVNLAAQVTQLENVFRSQAAGKNQTFTIQTTHLQHENVLCDKVSLNRVLNNIISNAVKYTPEGGHILFEIEELPREGHYARYKFVVQDDGIGMSPEYQKHLFEPFTREESSLTNKVQGTGLGMAITRSIISQMGGSIHVESQQGKGSRFEIMLDFKINEEADKNTNRLQLLLVNCPEETRVRIEDAARGKPVGVATVSRFEDALEQLRRNRYDAVLIALQDPELPDRVQQMRQIVPAETVILGAAALQRTEVTDRLTETGVDGFVPLPFFLSNLEAELARVKDARDHAVAEQKALPLQGMRFLCAEDNAINAEVLQAILEMAGASCKIYPNGAELVKAFETVQPGDYDMILMDVQMPVMDGLEATRAIRSGKNPLGKTIPILAMTANAFTEDMEKSKEAGMDEHLSKPVDIAVLERAVRKYLVTPPENEGPSTEIYPVSP